MKKKNKTICCETTSFFCHSPMTKGHTFHRLNYRTEKCFSESIRVRETLAFEKVFLRYLEDNNIQARKQTFWKGVIKKCKKIFLQLCETRGIIAQLVLKNILLQTNKPSKSFCSVATPLWPGWWVVCVATSGLTDVCCH